MSPQTEAGRSDSPAHTQIWHTVLSEALSFDGAFAPTAQAGPPAASLSAAAQWWDSSAQAKLLESPALPQSWQEIGNVLGRLSVEGPAGGGLAQWRAVCEGAEQLAQRDAVAGCLVALQALAAWEGGAQGRIYQMPVGQPPNPGWEVFPLSMCRCLRFAGASWAALRLARLASDTIGFASYAYHDDRIRDMIGSYRELLQEVERELAEAERTLAWELHKACGREPPSLRAELSALLWTLGDVAHAAALQGGADPAPALRVVEDAVHTSMRRMRSDPFLQYVWLELKDRPPLDLRAHTLLFARINAFYTDSPLHRLEATFGHVASPSRAYARALIAHFRGGVRDAQRSELGLAQEVMGQIDPGSSISARWHALYALAGPVETSADGGTDATTGTAQRQARWRAQTQLATACARAEHRDGQVDSYDRALDIPFQHVALDSLQERVEALDALERYRAACLWFALTRVRPTSLPTGPPVEQWLEREAALLEELPGLRFVRLLPDLPRGFSRIGMEFGARSSASEDGLSLLDPVRAIGRLAQIDQELTLVQTGLRGAAPAYAHRRADPAVSLQEFRQYLAP